MAETVATPMAQQEQQYSLFKDAFNRLIANRLAVVGMIVVVLLLLVAAIGPYITPYDFLSQDLNARNQFPSAAHWFGTDDLGRDVLSRVIYGARTAVFVAKDTAGPVHVVLRKEAIGCELARCIRRHVVARFRWVDGFGVHRMTSMFVCSFGRTFGDRMRAVRISSRRLLGRSGRLRGACLGRGRRRHRMPTVLIGRRNGPRLWRGRLGRGRLRSRGLGRAMAFVLSKGWSSNAEREGGKKQIPVHADAPSSGRTVKT